MSQEFEGCDLSGAVFWGVDLSGARFRDVNLTDVTISHALVVNVDIDALVERVVINGVDVTDFVNERDRWFPLRAMLRPTDSAGMLTAWTLLGREWATAIEQARQLTPAQRHESVDGQWSFVQTLRHLVFAMDKWFSLPILAVSAFDPIGLPNSGSVDFDWPGLDRGAEPSFEHVLSVRAAAAARFGEYLLTLTAGDLEREIDVLENGAVPLEEGIYTVFEEEFHHLRYALRDLDRLA
jgi:DinB superfamily/Pentapeptide repeats (8 copies)